MPNWCENEMVISGTPDELEQFVRNHIIDNVEYDPAKDAKCEQWIFDFNSIIPLPKSVDILDNDEVIKHWSTKWNSRMWIYDGIHEAGTKLEMTILTAWSPPDLIFEKLAVMYPTMKMVIISKEDGVGYCYRSDIADGCLVKTQLL